MRRRSSGGVRRPLTARSQPISNLIPSVTAEANVREAAARWIYENVNPNIYAVCSVQQSILVDRAKDFSYLAGDTELFQKVGTALRHNLSKKLHPNRYRKTKKLVPMAGTLEGDGINRRYHLNLFIKRPGWCPYEDFRMIFLETWCKCDWATRSKNAIYYAERKGDCVRYSLKEGSDTLLIF